MVEIVTLARALSDAGEHGVAAVIGRNVVNQLHDNDRLADTSTAEETDLAAASVRREQVDDLHARARAYLVQRGGGAELVCAHSPPSFPPAHLDARDKNVVGITHVAELRGRGVDGGELVRQDGAALVDRLADDVDNAAERAGADGHRDGCARVDDRRAAGKAVRGAHADRAHLRCGGGRSEAGAVWTK